MSVLDQDTARGDIVIRRGVTNIWGVLWEQSKDGASFIPVDLSRWVGSAQLRSPMGDVWLTVPAVTSMTGLTTVTITPSDLGGQVWVGRAGGSWVVDLGAPDGRVERLGQGYFHLEA